MAIRKGMWLPTVSYLPEDDRLGLSALLYPSGSTTSQLSVRAGCIPRPAVSGAGPLQVVASTGMNTQTTPGQYVYPGPSVNQGAYIVTNDAVVIKTHATADPSNARIDVVYMQVKDTSFGDATNDSDIFIAAGTPAGSPTAPAIPTGAQALAWVTVRAGTTSILSTDIADKRTFTTTLGGRALVTSFPANPFEGQECIRTDLLAGFVYLSSSWRQTFGATSSAESILYVSSRGNDSNDGLSIATAKLTLSAAFSALSGTGKIIIGAGTIDAGGTIDMTDRRAVVIEGLAPNSAGTSLSTVQYTSSGTSPVFKLLRASGCVLKNFELLYTNSGYTGDLIDLSGDVSGDGALCIVDGVTIVSSGSGVRTARSGIRLDNSDDKTIRNCTIHDVVNGIYARSVNTQYSNAVSVENCHFKNNVTSHIRNPGDGWTISKNIFEPLVSGAAGAVLTDATFTSNGVVITGNWLGDLTSAAGGTQFALSGSGIAVLGNFIGISGSSGATGVSFAAGSTGFTVNGNKFVGSNAAETAISADSACTSYDLGSNTYLNVTTQISGAPATKHISITPAKPGILVHNTNTSTDGRSTLKFQADRVSVKAYEVGVDVVGGSTKVFEIYDRTAGVSRLRITTAGSVVATGAAVLANAATDGFLYIPVVAGAPTGVPTTQTGSAPIVFDTTNSKIWMYVGGAWKGVVLT